MKECQNPIHAFFLDTLYDMRYDMIYDTGCFKKTHEQDFGILSWISQDVNIVKGWEISQMKGDIHA